MSWWASLCDRNGIPLEVGRHAEGGTYVMGGTSEAELNVTYNYGGQFRQAWPEPLEGSGALGQMLDGRTGAETAPLLRQAVAKLGTEPSKDYWDSSAGNAGRALATLLAWAERHPNGVWKVS